MNGKNKVTNINGRNTITTSKKRIFIVLTAFALFLSFLIYNLFNLQYINYAYYKDKVYEQITTSSPLKAKRGNIYDSNMNLLATDKTVWRVFVSSRDIKKATKNDNCNYTEIIARGLSEILKYDYEQLFQKISKSNVLDITIKKNATEEEYKKILELIENNSLEGMLLTEAQSSRYYPEETLAAHTLGFVGSDLQGLYGLEYYYNSVLSGKDGYYLYGRDANGNVLPNEYTSFVEAEDGYSLVTTIDSYLQEQLEATIEEVRINHSVENRVTGIAMDISSGAVLAMATTTPFNPNSPYELDFLSEAKLNSSGYEEGSDEYKAYKKELLEIMWSNKAVSETYEPGSTFKIITVASALDAGAVKTTDTFSCHGYLAIGGWHIKCHKTQGHGSGFSLAYGLQMSCNPCMMTVAERLGADAFYEYVKAFGYLDKTGIDLPSEATGIFHKKENIGTTELATASFGQRFKVSIIRQLTSICTVANGGKTVTPYLVSKIIDKDGNIIKEHSATEGTQVISPEVAATVTDILEKGVSGDGGAKNAAVEGYKIAGKTGTSQKFDILDENGNSYLRIGSTVAYSISESGGVAVIIVVDEPTSAVKYGSVVAAPYVSAFLSKALPYLNYESTAEKEKIEIPSFIGMSVEEAKKEIQKAGLQYEIIGNGYSVVGQTPGYGDKLYKESGKIIVYTEDSEKVYVEVPNVVGMDAYMANKILSEAGLNIIIKGIKDTSGGTYVTSQSLTFGSVVPKNSIIEIEILYLEFED